MLLFLFLFFRNIRGTSLKGKEEWLGKWVHVLSSAVQLLPCFLSTLALITVSILRLPKGVFCLGPGLSDASPDEGLIEDLSVEDRAVEQLAEGLLSHYLPDLQRSKQALQELT